MEHPAKSLAYALEKYPDRVEVVPLEEVVIESARQNPKRPAFVKLAVGDDLVKSLRGTEKERDLLLLVRVPRAVVEREKSRIVLPGEVR
jgi:hypothetical protein